MRDAFLKSLNHLAQNDKDIILLTADLGFGVFEQFEIDFPNQFFNVGVAEQNMTGLAVGLSLEGKKVVTYSIGNFPILIKRKRLKNIFQRKECGLQNIFGKIQRVNLVLIFLGLNRKSGYFKH